MKWLTIVYIIFLLEHNFVSYVNSYVNSSRLVPYYKLAEYYVGITKYVEPEKYFLEFSFGTANGQWVTNNFMEVIKVMSRLQLVKSSNIIIVILRF